MIIVLVLKDLKGQIQGHFKIDVWDNLELKGRGYSRSHLNVTFSALSIPSVESFLIHVESWQSNHLQGQDPF